MSEILHNEMSVEEMLAATSKLSVEIRRPEMWCRVLRLEEEDLLTHSPSEFASSYNQKTPKDSLRVRIFDSLKSHKDTIEKTDTLLAKIQLLDDELLLGSCESGLLITNYRLIANEKSSLFRIAADAEDILDYGRSYEKRQQRQDRFKPFVNRLGPEEYVSIPLWEVLPPPLGHGRKVGVGTSQNTEDWPFDGSPMMPVLSHFPNGCESPSRLVLNMEAKKTKESEKYRQNFPAFPVTYLWHLRFWMGVPAKMQAPTDKHVRWNPKGSPPYLNDEEIQIVSRGKTDYDHGDISSATGYTVEDLTEFSAQDEFEPRGVEFEAEIIQAEESHCPVPGCKQEVKGNESAVHGEPASRSQGTATSRTPSSVGGQDSISDILMELRQISPREFEYLIRDLLVEMGYSNVKVTSESNDRGVDVVAELDFGLNKDVEVIQAKRFAATNKVGRPTLDTLRGSLHRFDARRGTIVTTSSFTKGAVRAASASGAKPISLVNGEDFVEHLTEHDFLESE